MIYSGLEKILLHTQAQAILLVVATYYAFLSNYIINFHIIFMFWPYFLQAIKIDIFPKL